MGEDKKKRSRFRKVSIFKEVDETPSRFLGNLCPTNLEEQKEGFLKHGILPKFKMRTSQAEIDKITAKSRGQIRFDLLNEAKVIIQKVKKEFGDGQKYLEAAYGPPTDFITGTEVIAKYLMECNCEGEITVYWTRQLECR
ncbi:hypothetical protein CAPTEDRAFT_188801 [Capitella teleta]|uniref:Uncharacterized protein n=1 Tax=Capitella teleta TaxID=283909 RepID=R7USU6_CAPTE|nr:hypothetical protein CAPTEDRAFT_188801 [Capitella teleta]|eukprot:ELU06476.1 hypothetical protein CAPTEDRAFT_188801 [Capitella teleta]